MTSVASLAAVAKLLLRLSVASVNWTVPLTLRWLLKFRPTPIPRDSVSSYFASNAARCARGVTA